MKKLLALILCVMLFVSIIPTAAFAADATARASGEADKPFLKASEYKKEIANMIKNTKASIETAYGVLVGDQVVYATAKGMDDVLVGLVDGIAADLIANGKMSKDVADTAKETLRAVIDTMVATEMAKNAYKYTDGTKIDPVKYAQVFSKAVADTLTNKDFQKGYEDVATYFALSALVKNVNDQLKKEQEAFAESVNASFDKNFEKYYPELWENYVDTLTDLANDNLHQPIPNPWGDYTSYPAAVGAVS